MDAPGGLQDTDKAANELGHGGGGEPADDLAPAIALEQVGDQSVGLVDGEATRERVCKEDCIRI